MVSFIDISGTYMTAGRFQFSAVPQHDNIEVGIAVKTLNLQWLCIMFCACFKCVVITSLLKSG